MDIAPGCRIDSMLGRLPLSLCLPAVLRDWADCTAAPDAELWRELPYALRGRPCVGGLDVGVSAELSSLCLYFPPQRPGGRHTYLWWLWLPEASTSFGHAVHGPHLRAFRDAGMLIVTPGGLIKPELMGEQILHLLDCFQVRGLAVDPYNGGDVSNILREKLDGRLRLVRQGFLGMSAPTRAFLRQIESASLEHGNHPVARWMLCNTTIERDAAGNMRLAKGQTQGGIDGIVAAVMALGCMDQVVADGWGS